MYLFCVLNGGASKNAYWDKTWDKNKQLYQVRNKKNFIPSLFYIHSSLDYSDILPVNFTLLVRYLHSFALFKSSLPLGCFIYIHFKYIVQILVHSRFDLSSLLLSNWTSTSDSNDSLTDKCSSHFSTAKGISVNALRALVHNIHTLESGINVALRLLIFWLFSRGYGLIPDFIV